MPRQPRFEITFAPEVLEHLEHIERKHHGLLEEAIETQLAHTPDQQTRNRKPLEQPSPFEATWELRCGPKNRYRIFYELSPDERSVTILAIGEKQRNRLIIGGEEFES